MAETKRLDSGDIVLTMSQSEAITNASALIILKADPTFHFTAPSAIVNRDSILAALKKVITDHG